MKRGGKIFGHRWHSPTWRYIEPNKDAQADALRLEEWLTSPRRRAAEQGYDHFDLSREGAEDAGREIADSHIVAEELNKKYGLDLTWRDVRFLRDSQQRDQMPMPEPAETGAADVG